LKGVQRDSRQYGLMKLAGTLSIEENKLIAKRGSMDRLSRGAWRRNAEAGVKPYSRKATGIANPPMAEN
jgi:hypothetical protein